MINLSEYLMESAFDDESVNLDPVEIEYTPKNSDELVDAIYEVAKAQARHKVINFNCIDTSAVTDMERVFFMALRKMPGQRKKDFLCNQWDVSNVESFDGTFYDCFGFTGKGLEGWNVSNKCKSAFNMFHSCVSLETLNMRNWDLRGFSNAANMFYGCEKLKTVNLPDVMPKFTNAQYMFAKCDTLTNVQLPGTASEVMEHTGGMFYGSGIKGKRLIVDNLDSIVLPKDKEGSVHQICMGMFTACGIKPKILRDYINAQNLSDNDIARLGIDNSRL
jgi:hypothetical protein